MYRKTKATQSFTKLSLFQQPLYFCFVICILTLAGCSTTNASQPSAKVISTATPHVQPTLQPTLTPTSAPTLTPTPAVASPVHITIPSVGIDASIESLGTTADGNMATPTQSPWTATGWYNLGPRPGEPGSAVIDGHLDRPGGAPAVFWNLRNVQPGASVTVTDADGKVLQFRVLRIMSYPPTQAPLQDIFGNTSGTFLNLITCAGDWIPAQHQTTLRLVVYTALT